MSFSDSNETKIVDFDDLDTDIKNIIFEAIEARKYFYHRNFAVGACLLTENGKLYSGCNVKSFCAERTAVVKAISDGNRKFKSIAVIGQQEDSFTTPCGSCRQVLAEFNPNIVVYVTRPTLGKVLVSSIKLLMPQISFDGA